MKVTVKLEVELVVEHLDDLYDGESYAEALSSALLQADFLFVTNPSTRDAYECMESVSVLSAKEIK